MFETLKSRIYGNRAIDRAAALLVEANGEERGQEAAGAFGAILSKQMETGEVPKNLFARYRASGLTIDEAAVSALDGCVSSVRRLMGETASTAALRKVVHAMENAIDHLMRTCPGKVIPRNGRFAEAFERSDLKQFLSK